LDEGRRIDRRSIFHGRVLHLFVDRVRLPNDAETELEVLEHPGAAAVVAVDARDRVLLVRQYRYATGEWLLEVPAGKLDAGEPPDTCARRELEEETGHRAGTLRPLGWIWTTPGFTNEKIWLYLATDLVATEQALQSDELLAIEPFPWRQAVDLAASGEIHDGKSVAALLRAARLLEG
jgi:ADP-ribose pyrophosphatase